MTEALVTETTWTVFLDLTANPSWHALSRGARDEILAAHLAPLLAEHAATTRFTWYDADAFSAVPTDVAMVTTTDLGAWTALLSALKDSPMLAHGHYTLGRVLVTQPSGRG